MIRTPAFSRPACRWLASLAIALSLAGHAAWAIDKQQLDTLVSGDISDKVEVIQALATANDSPAYPILSALGAGELVADSAGHAYIDHDGKVVDAYTGQAVTVAADTLEKVGINNRVRRELDGAMAGLKLAAPERSARLAAVTTLRDSADEAMLPKLQARLKLESDTEIRDMLARIVARIELSSPDPQIRLHAAQTLATSGAPEVKALLAATLTAEADPAVKAALETSLGAVSSRLYTGELLGSVFTGVSLGSVLLLAALGLAITYGLLGVINMAHGEMLMVGAYSTYLVQNLFRSALPQYFDWYVLAALPAAFVASGLLGIVLERTVIRHLYGRPLETLLATWGISLMLMQAVRILFGAQNVEVANPSWLSGSWQALPNLVLPYNRMIIIAFAAAVLIGVWLLINKTRLGLFVRAVTQNRKMAGCVGVSTSRVDMLAFGLGSGIAGLAGVALSQIGNVGPDLGQSYIVDSFMVVVVGGVGQLAGTVLASLGLGILAKFLEPSVGAVLAKITILALIIIFIQKRPQGMFALKGRFVEN